MSVYLTKNTILEWLPSSTQEESILVRVLWVDLRNDIAYVIRIHDKKALPVSISCSEVLQSIQLGTTLVRTVDPFGFLSGLSESYGKSHAKKARKAWEILQPLVGAEPDIYFPEKRSRMIQHATKEHTVTKRYLYIQLERFWQRGMSFDALLPDYRKSGAPNREKKCRHWQTCGDNRLCCSGHRCPNEKKRGRPPKLAQVDMKFAGVNISESDRKTFNIASKLYYKTTEKRPLKTAYNKMIDKFYSIGEKIEYGKPVPILAPSHKCPTFEQFKYWYDKTKDLSAEVKVREGQRKLEMNYRPLLSHSTSLAFGPGSVFMIDATIGDITLVSRLDRTCIIGRPIIYFVIDVFSRMVVGFQICLYGPSWYGAALALANAATSKVELCARYGIGITEEKWPCHHLAEQIIADRGEMICDASDSLVTSFNISIGNCAPYRPDYKGIVERYFRTTNEAVLHWLPGDTKPRDFGTPDNRLNAKLDIKDLTKIIISSIIEHNNSHWLTQYPMDCDMIADGVSPIPSELWQWGIENRVGRLREESRQTVICKLLPQTSAKITDHGVRALDLHYTCDQAGRFQWFQQARTSGTWQELLAYDPHTLNEAYLIGNDGEIITCTLLPRDEQFNDLCHEELQEYYALKNTKKRLHLEEERQGESDQRSYADNIIFEAISRTKQAQKQKPPSSKQSQLRDIKQHRIDENDFLRREEALYDGYSLPDKTSRTSETKSASLTINPRTSLDDDVLDKIISACEVQDEEC